MGGEGRVRGRTKLNGVRLLLRIPIICGQIIFGGKWNVNKILGVCPEFVAGMGVHEGIMGGEISARCPEKIFSKIEFFNSLLMC